MERGAPRKAPTGALAAFSLSAGGSPRSDCGLAVIPFGLTGIRRRFSGAEGAPGKADDEILLAQGEEDNTAQGQFPPPQNRVRPCRSKVYKQYT